MTPSLGSCLLCALVAFLPLAQGVVKGYTPNTDVLRLLNFAYDIRDMREAADDFAQKRSIYLNGKNAGESLASLSLRAGTLYEKQSMYNLYRHAFDLIGSSVEGDTDGEFDGASVDQYANTLVEDLLKLNITNIEAEAALAHNVMMAFWGSLFAVLDGCRANDANKMNANLDTAAALWVGANQAEDDNEDGYMLYHMAEFAGANFLQDNGESTVNSNIVATLNTMQQGIANGTCGTEQGYVAIREYVRKMVGYSNTVLVQQLLFYVWEHQVFGSDFVELFALSVLPQVASCDSGLYDHLMELLVFNDMSVDNKVDAIVSIQRSFSCLGITCQDVGSLKGDFIPACNDDHFKATRFAQYESKTDVVEHARIDRDIKHLEIMLHYGAFAMAADYYRYGWHTSSSVRDYVTDTISSDATSQVFESFRVFYQSSDNSFADRWIESALAGTAEFHDANNVERANAAISLIKGLGMYLSVSRQIELSLAECYLGNAAKGTMHWDAAAALFVGSAEGETNGGQSGGESLFAIAKGFCKDFNTCEPNDAAVDEMILTSLRVGGNQIEKAMCDQAKSIVDTNIKTNLLVPLIQGTLWYSARTLIDGSRQAGASAGLFGFSRGILPYIDDQSDLTIVSAISAFNTTPMTPSELDGLFTAFRNVVTSLAIACHDVGQLRTSNGDRGVCNGAPISSLYQPSTDVSSLALLSADVKEMRERESAASKMTIYQNGKNALPQTLASLSLDWQGYVDSPMFVFYKYAFLRIGGQREHDASGNFDNHPVEQYADTLVLDLFEDGKANLSGDASLVFNVLMGFWVALHDVSSACQSADGSRMQVNLDRAAALYYGTRILENPVHDGFALFDLAEEARVDFPTSNVNGVVANSFASLQKDIANNTCSSGSQGYQNVRQKIQRLSAIVNVPVVQMLRHHVDLADVEASKAYVELFSLAIVPQISNCNPSLANEIFGLTIESKVTNEVKSTVSGLLVEAFSCLGVTCDDVGGFKDTMACDGLKSTNTLASYTTGYDVSRKSLVDRDVLQVEILVSTGATNAALDYYQSGWNTYFSLHQLATNKFTLNGSPAIFDQFNAYFASAGVQSMDGLIVAAIQGSAPFDSLSPEYSADVTKNLLRNMLSYVAISAELDSAIDSCEAGDDTAAVLTAWDGAAALYVGASEGPIRGGSDGGQFLYGRAKVLCDYFGTCISGGASVNEAILRNLRDGQGALKQKKCLLAQQVAQDQVKPRLLVPLLQDTILFATLALGDENKEQDLVGLLGASRALLPVLHEVDPSFATTLADRAASRTQFSREDWMAVLGVLHDAIPALGVPCEEIGSLATFNVQGTTDYEICDPSSIGRTSAPLNAPSLAPVTRVPTTEAPIFTPPADPNGLAWGRYTFIDETRAERDAAFSLDVKDMYMAEDAATAMSTYTSGRHALSGLSINSTIRSLEAFSTRASDLMSEDIMYNFFRAAFYDGPSFESGASDAQGWPFGDSVVQLALGPSNGNSPILGSEAAVVMNSWMMISHMLYESTRKCAASDDDAALFIDSSVALWIGKEQGNGAFDSGFMMYSVAQEAHKNFGHSAGESPVNTRLMDFFNDAQSVARTCSEDVDRHRELRVLVDDIVRELSKPLLQQIIFYMSDLRHNYVQLYALSFIPQAFACNKDDYDYLGMALVDSFDETRISDEVLTSHLASVSRCLRFSCTDFGDASSLNNPSLKELVTSLCNELDVAYDPSLLAAYKSSNDVSEIARLDLDVHQFDILMQTRSYGAARDVYMYGRNSKLDEASYRSLQSMAVDPSMIQAGALYESYRTYFNKDGRIDLVVSSTINDSPEGPYAGAARLQRSEIASRTLQTHLSFLHIVSRLKQSVTSCFAGTDGTRSVDEAVALFVGSMEGSRSGGVESNSGHSLMSLGKIYCTTFNKCETHGDASINKFLMFAFSDLKQWLVSGDCENANATVSENILPSLPVPLVQGVLASAVANELLQPGTESASLATGAVLADFLLPMVFAVNETSAVVLESNMKFDRSEKAVVQGASKVAEALSFALRAMDIDCHAVGNMVSLGISTCNADQLAPIADTSTNLGDDLYVTTTYVQDRADIALDIKQMTEQLRRGSSAEAKLIYKDGLNSKIFDEEGSQVGFRSLANFSMQSKAGYARNPLFQITVFALRDDNGLYLGKEAHQYANTIVEESFGAGGATSLAADAAVALNLWMEIANELFSAVTHCQNKKISDFDGVHSIDEAVAYWIGDGQIAGESERGHLLYALAEKLGDRFNLNDASGQSRTNVNILRLFQQAKIELTFPDACRTDPNTSRRLRTIVNKITSIMVAVNIQALIDALYEEDRARVRVYAHSAVPLVAGCSQGTFWYLKSKLLDGDYLEVEVGSIIEALQSSYACLGIRCDDIGVHRSESKSTCTDPTLLAPLAGYRPNAFVQEYAQIDLDIFELGILLDMEAFDAASDLYNFGKHSLTRQDGDKASLSLEVLATSSERQKVPEFEAYEKYFKDGKYADTLMKNALSESEHNQNFHRKHLATSTSKFFILQMAIKQSLYSAVDACRSTRDSTVDLIAERWDAGAAFIVGSKEGPMQGGSGDGSLLWALAKEHCEEFGTCSREVSSSANVNDKIQSLLYSGRGAITAGACDHLEKVVSDLKPLLSVAIIQAIFSNALKMFETRRKSERDELWTKAYVYTQSLIPMIAEKDKEAARVLGENFDFQGRPEEDGLFLITQALSRALPVLGIDCMEVGSSPTIDPCAGVITKEESHMLGILLGVFIGIVAAVGIAALLMSKQNDKSRTVDPEFVRSDGELNHLDPILATARSLDDVEDTTASNEEGDGLIDDCSSDENSIV